MTCVVRARLAFALTLVALCLSLGAEAAGPKRVLLLHSFGRDFAPYDAIASVFRAELARNSTEPIVISEATLDAGRALTDREQRAFFDYLGARFEGSAPDLVVTMGPYPERLTRFFSVVKNPDGEGYVVDQAFGSGP